MGSLLTEGNHLYLAPELEAGSPRWCEVLATLVQALRADATEAGADATVLRDLPGGAEGEALAGFLAERGFNPIPTPGAYGLSTAWADEAELVAGLSRKARRHQRLAVAPWNDAYTCEILGVETRPPTAAELDRMESLYRAVTSRSLELNTFDLPRRFFAAAGAREGWEILALRPRAEDGDGACGGAPLVGFVVSTRSAARYTPLVVGLDYRFVRERGLYRQCLRHSVLRAKSLGAEWVSLGIGAPLEKSRFGAHSEPAQLFMSVDDAFVFEQLEALAQGMGASESPPVD